VLPVGWLILAVAVAILLTMWITFTITRLDRLHARVDAAQAAMDAQLVRRAAALDHVARSSGVGLSDAEHARLAAVVDNAMHAGPADRESAENAVGRAVAGLVEGPAQLPPEADRELREAAARVLIARRFYNDAVRDTRALRARRMPRLLRLAGHREMPQFFDIDDTAPNPDTPARSESPARPDTPAREVPATETPAKETS
jgi:hypothetical protein